MIKNRLGLVVLILSLSILGTLLSMGIQRAGIAAGKMHSQNNLKMIGLAFHNHESAFKRFPFGCDEKALHGWMMFTQPYMESSPLFSETDFDIAWDQGLNRYRFMVSRSYYKSPRNPNPFTTDGMGITDYHANPALLHRGSKVTFSAIEAGLASTWLAAEIAGEQTPFAYPYNWRELKGINNGPDSLGGWHDGGPFVFADGSVRYLSNAIDPSLIAKYANAFPLPDRERYDKPERDFELTGKNPYSSKSYVEQTENVGKERRTQATVWFGPGGSAECLDVAYYQAMTDQLTEQYSTSKSLKSHYPSSELELAWIMRLRNLETLVLVSRYSENLQRHPEAISLDELLESLRMLPRLKTLKLVASDEELASIQVELPNCNIIRTKGE